MILYFLVAIGATIVGALTGMGGGVIIKPVLDLLGQYDAATIGILSSVTVLTMSIVSIGKQIRQKASIRLEIALPLALGSVLGGWLGAGCLGVILQHQDNSRVVILQNVLLGLLLRGVFFYMKRKEHLPTLHRRGLAAGLLTGLFAGLVSTFLGIGGGPINVAVLIFVFSMDTKAAAVNSIITIFFAQVAKLSAVLLGEGFVAYDLSVLPVMLIGAVAGGWLGARISKVVSEKTVEKAFNLVQLAVLALCVYNIWQMR